MAKISNKFIVTALLDGQTVSGELVSTRSLWQALDNQGNCYPNWEADAEGDRPKLYPLLQSGSVVLAPKTIAWKYNNETITFDATTKLSTNAAFAGTFKLYDHTPSGGVQVPCLIIMKNLAALSTNENNDTISMSGTVTVNDTDLSFEAMQMVRITKAGATANVGELILVNGKKVLNGDNDTVSIKALYHSNETGSTSNYTVKWYWNDYGASDTPKRTTTGAADAHTITITGSEVEDYVVVEARFFVNNVQKAVAFIGIDDIGDIDQMQFAYAIYNSSETPPTSIIQNNTSAATLKSGQSVRYGIWIGTTEDPLEQRSTAWTYSANIYASDAKDITNTSDTTKFIAQPTAMDITVGTTALENVGVMDISFAKTVANGGQVSIIIMATATTV